MYSLHQANTLNSKSILDYGSDLQSQKAEAKRSRMYMEHQLTAMTNAEERATLQIVRKYDINSAFQTNHSAKKMAFPCSSHVTFAILICC